MLHQLPKNVFSSRLVSTLAITTHPQRCCVDHDARLVHLLDVADKLANGKEPKEARRGCAIAIARWESAPHPLAEHPLGRIDIRALVYAYIQLRL